MSRAELCGSVAGLAGLMSVAGRVSQSPERILDALHQAGLVPNRDSVRLGECLERLLRRCPWSWGDRKPLGVLNLACGRAPETVTLVEVLAAYSRTICYTGVDVRAKALDVARQRGQGLSRVFGDLMGGECQSFTTRYAVGDLASPEFVRTLPGRQGLVLIRHQNVGFSVPVWTAIFDLALERLDPDGVLVLTSHYDHEHAVALNVMSALGTECLGVERMPDPRVIGPGGKAVDRFLAAFRRGGDEGRRELDE